ncbi:MAG: hypothetical protein WCO63_16525, partial [Bacteroidota bacterium]
KELSCPDELKILVADMFTQNDRFRDSHELLFLAETPEEESFAAINCVEGYLANREIWLELNFFKVHGVILGDHPIFEIRQKAEVLRKCNSSELSRKRANMYINLTKTKKSLTKNDTPRNTEKRIRSVTIKTRLIAEIDNILKNR